MAAHIPFTGNHLDLSTDRGYLFKCGATLSPKRQCKDSGHDAEGTPKFCPDCGAKD